MTLRSVPIEEISQGHLRTLVDDDVAELRTIEYKRELPGSTSDDKKEFLADVSSLANANGGDLVYGVNEENGIPIEVPGFETDDIDAVILRLEASIRDGISPRIQGLTSQPVPLASGRHALVIRIPRSFSRPHVVTYRNHWKFFTRSSAGKHQMDIDEVRGAFLASEGVADKVRSFREERLRLIISDAAPVSLEGDARAVLHLVPLSAFDLPTPALDLDLQHSALRSGLLCPISWGGILRHNFDGLISAAQRAGGAFNGYAQLFRSGAVEAADHEVFGIDNGHPIIAHEYFEQSVIEATAKNLELQRQLGVTPPVLVMLSLTGVKGYRMLVDALSRHHAQPVDRDDLIVPETMIEDSWPDRSGVERLLRPMFDAIWNACGFSGSPNFDDTGRWNPQGRRR